MIPYLMSLLGSALLIGTLVQTVLLVFQWQRLAWLPAASCLLCLLPVNGLSVGRWIHSFTGYLSIPLVVLLAWHSLAPLLASRAANQKLISHYWLLMALAGAIYFPMSMGLGNIDPHGLGWKPEFIWIPVVLSIAAILLGNGGLAGLLMLGTIAWQLNLFGITNGWNYLIDPLAVGFSVASLIAVTLKALLATGQNSLQPAQSDTKSTVTSSESDKQSRAA